MPIIDPHKVFDNGENVDISNLNFFAELKVYKRNRLSSNNSVDSNVAINFIGGTNNEFTTNWTENKENFGITNINYKVNSSYVPQVDITFQDVRGQSLFNDFNNSKYNVLFDMPPPLFELTIKGYYGQAVKYNLHLLRITSKVKTNGSFEINASFVGMTFAPLADILVDYLEVAPYLVDEKLLTGDVDTTLELKNSAKELINEVKTATDADRKFINDKSLLKTKLETQLSSGDFVTTFMENINSIDTVNTGQNKSILAERKGNVVTIKLKYFYITNTWIDKDSKNAITLYTDLKTRLANVKTDLFTNTGLNLPKSYPSNLPEFTNLGTNKLNNDSYIVKATIDFGDINNQIKTTITNLTSDIKDKSNFTAGKVETIVFEKIKGGPTLSNVLKILMADAKRFYDSLNSVVVNAQQNRKGNNDVSHGDAPKYAFPEYFTLNENNQKVKSIPKDETWDEVKFVNKYINSKMKAVNFEATANFEKDSDGNYKYAPISPFDSPIYSTNIYKSVTKDSIFNTVVSRGNVFLKETFAKQNVNAGVTTDIIKSYAKGEAYNIMSTLKSTDLLNWFILQVQNNKIQTSPFITLDFTKPVYNVNTASISSKRFNFDGTYSGLLNFDILSKSDFDNIDGGVPVVKQSTGLSNDLLVNKTEGILETLKGFFYSLTGLDGKLVYSQYNVPFNQDIDAKSNTNNKNYGSDYFNGHLFLNNTSQTDSNEFDNYSGHTATPDDFLTYLNGNNLNISYTKSPFEVDAFKKIGSISEVPLIILAWWGYISKNYIININNLKNLVSKFTGINYIESWSQIPLDLQSKFISVYDEYVNIFNANKSDLDLLVNQDINFFLVKDGFFSSIIENKYLILGSTLFFNTTYPQKQIDFSEQYELYDVYFNTLSSEIKNNVNQLAKTEKDTQQAVNVALNDGDVRTELYYSFKSFVDRWMLGGTSFNFSNLFDVDSTFLMVDRAFNPIGNKVILDLTPLWDTATSQDTSLYTLLINLLTKNNFEFFALPTFIDFKDSNGGGPLWSDGNVNKIFGTFPNIPVASNPKFICMYIGGTSAQLDVGQILPDSVSHEDDGGSIGSTNNKNNIEDVSNSESVTAFKIDFGTVNQSFFTQPEFDQLEFKETNESIILLDKIANSMGKDVTETKSNSLFNVYQQRSYTGAFETLGNAMIQPTMYFDLTNIALFKGAYLILEVNHNITANNFKTKFKGVRVPKYMKPYVTKYSMIVNLDIGYGSDQNNITSTNSTNTGGVNGSSITDVKKALPSLGKINNPSLTSKDNLTASKKAMLDVIAYAEGTTGVGDYNGYDLLVGYGKIPGYTPNYSLPHNGNPAFADMNGTWFSRKQNSGASGRYQINYGTWLIGTTNNPFNNTNQDNRALQYIQERFNIYHLDFNSITQDNFVKYIDTLANVWASLPYNNTINVPPKNPNWNLGSGFYPGQGGQHTVDELYLVYIASYKKYMGTFNESDLNTQITQTLTPDQQNKINTLHPSVKDKFKTLVQAIQSKTGYQVLINSTYRSLSSQQAQYDADSRNAPVGQSLHQYGLAFDINLIKNGTQLLKSTPTSVWTGTGAIQVAKDLGFAWGGEFKGYEDNVHFEILQPNGQRYSGAALFAKAQQLFGANLTNFDGTKINVA